MNKFKKKYEESPGQALVEFALVISAVLMMMFLIIESARILWAWNTVQHAAREGARYAITGQFDGPTCAVNFGLAKFVQGSGRDVCQDLRVASIINISHSSLTGLPLNEVSTTFEDDNYYNIEIWGADEFGQLQYDFAGIPDNPVIVRVTYRVPIITPFFTPIRDSIPVFGQEVLNNESFGSLGSGQGQPLPPNLQPVPTPGVTPSPTPSPTPSDTPTSSPTDTPTATATSTPTGLCVEIEGHVLETNDFLFVAGNINETVDIIDLTTNTVLQSVAPFAAFSGHACDPPAGTGGFVTITGLGGLLIQGHVLAAVSSDGAVDTAIVLGSPPTLTPTSTSTPIPTSTPSPTATPTSSPTPSQPYIVLIPDCGVPAQPQGPVTFNVIFINWPTNQSLTLLWEGAPELVWQAGQHNGSFSIAVTKILPYPASQVTYSVQAQSGSGQSDTDLFTVPCTLVPTSTPNPGATSTPAPEDLVILGAPVLISTRPIVAYQPVQFTVPITNAGDVDVSSQFFVDIYLDPNPSVVLTTTIPISESDGYSAVSQLAGHTGKVITITSPFGFTNNPPTHLVYGFVDSLEQINEIDETNNISLTPQPVIDVTPGTPPTATSTPGGSDEISGGALTLGNDLILQFRAQMMLIDDSTGSVVARTTSDTNGFYRFSSVSSPASTYTVAGCITIDGADWYGTRTGIVPPNLTAHVIMLKQPCP